MRTVRGRIAAALTCSALTHSRVRMHTGAPRCTRTQADGVFYRNPRLFSRSLFPPWNSPRDREAGPVCAAGAAVRCPPSGEDSCTEWHLLDVAPAYLAMHMCHDLFPTVFCSAMPCCLSASSDRLLHPARLLILFRTRPRPRPPPSSALRARPARSSCLAAASATSSKVVDGGGGLPHPTQ